MSSAAFFSAPMSRALVDCAEVLGYDTDERVLLAVAMVASAHDVTAKALLGARRHRRLADARNHLYYELYDELGSYPKVARAVGRDHTTVLSGRRRWARQIGDVGVLP